MADKEPKVNTDTSSSTAVTPHTLVTEDHVWAALISDKGAAAHLTDWKLVNFTKKGDNYVCVVTSVEVQYVLNGKSSEVIYVVKLNSGRAFGSGNNFNEIVFENESKFYHNLAGQINSVLKEIGHSDINFPKYLHSNLEKGKEILFLKDLRPNGYKMADRKRGLDKAHAALVVRELARLHAASLLLQNKTPDENLGEKCPYLKRCFYYFISNFDSMLNLMTDNLKFAREIITKVGGYERVTAWIDTVIPNLVEIFYEQLECGEPKVVCHGDCWINNLLFKYSEDGHPEDVMLLDLQLVAHTTPVFDLNFLFLTSMTGDVRKHNSKALLGSYYSTFRDIMEDGGQKVPFTQEQLLKDFKTKKLIGSIFAMMFVPMMMFETEETEDSSKDSYEDIQEMFRDVREKSMDMLDTNPLVKERFLSVFDEMMEDGIIP